MKFVFAVIALAAVANANVATAPGSALKLVSSSNALKVAEFVEHKAVTTVTAAAKKVVAAPVNKNAETLKMVGLFTLWLVMSVLFFRLNLPS